MVILSSVHSVLLRHIVNQEALDRGILNHCMMLAGVQKSLK